MIRNNNIQTKIDISKRLGRGIKKVAKVLYAFPSAIMDGDLDDDAFTPPYESLYNSVLNVAGRIHLMGSGFITTFPIVKSILFNQPLELNSGWYYGLASLGTNLASGVNAILKERKKEKTNQNNLLESRLI